MPLIAVLYLVLGTPKVYAIQGNTAQVKTDSVLFFIRKSKSKSITKTKELQFLRRAYGKLHGIDNDSLRTRYLSILSYALLSMEDSVLFRRVNKAAIANSLKLGDSLKTAEAYWDLGSFFSRKMIKDSAYYSFSESQKIYEDQDNMYYSGRMLYNMAKQQADVKDYIGSETTTISAIERLKPLKKYRQLYNCYNNLGISSNALGEHELALQYYEEALFYLSKMDNPKLLLAGNINNVGIVYRDKKDYTRAIQKFKEVLKRDSLKQKDPILYAKALNSLALCKVKLMDTIGTYALIIRSIQMKDSLNDARSLASSYANLAEYQLLRKDTVASIVASKNAIALARESSNNEQMLETLAFLSKIDDTHASSYAQRYIRLNDSLQKEERQARNKFARIRFETDEFIAENVQLEQQRVLLSRQKQMWTIIALVFLLLGISLYIIISQRSKNQKLVYQQQQQANNQEIFNLMLSQKQKVDEVKRSEQKRISEELHDGVLGKMLGARMVLTGLNKRSDEDSVKERLEAIAALKNVEGEVRSISHELSHNAYQKINNFIHSIESLLNTTEANNRINAIFTYDDEEDWDSLKGDIKINVYRMIQESIQNAIKHSECENFFINFERNDDIFLVTMNDDGKGFKSNKGKKGIGMRNISSRVSKLNGTWSVVSTPGKGTKITLGIPIQLDTVSGDMDAKEELQNV
ncbi:ATP-binding protein [Maribacter sp. 2304DJ31-5]|uniref:tetratricopeptide repeat-containing sensor histidine kinase n=1 Tax=Maribacter sp. 2304DJ31-5 TaxID=3386273 RepID=UPI0039BD7E86